MPTRLLATLAVAVAVVIALAVAVWRSERTVQRARTVLTHAEGLREGSAVTYRGVVVGIVSQMAFDTNGIAVDLAFRREVPLRTGDSADVRTLGLLGDKAIDIVPGPSSAALLPSDRLIPARTAASAVPEAEVIELIRRLSDTARRDTGADPPRP